MEDNQNEPLLIPSRMITDDPRIGRAVKIRTLAEKNTIKRLCVITGCWFYEKSKMWMLRMEDEDGNIYVMDEGEVSYCSS